MSSNAGVVPASKRFTEIYNTLPPEYQRELIEVYLSPLLDQKSEETDTILQASLSRQLEYSSLQVPRLRPREKRREINELLHALGTDARVGFTRARSDRDELLVETIDLLGSWLQDIWRSTFQFRVNFVEAHACLLQIIRVLWKLEEAVGGFGTIGSILGGYMDESPDDHTHHHHGRCACVSFEYPAKIAIRKAGSSTPIKSWVFTHPGHVVSAVIWVWRELLVSMISSWKSSDSQGLRNTVDGILEDIQETILSEGLERLLYGGDHLPSDVINASDERAEDDEWEDVEDSDSDILEEPHIQHSSLKSPLHATHWPSSLEFKSARLYLGSVVYARLVEQFRSAPSLGLFQTIVSIPRPISSLSHGGLAEQDVDQSRSQSRAELCTILQEVAPISGDALAAALDIFSLPPFTNASINTLMELLDQHLYLLRPYHAKSLQAAVLCLAEFGSTTKTSPTPLATSSSSIITPPDQVPSPSPTSVSTSTPLRLAVSIISRELLAIASALDRRILARFSRAAHPVQQEEINRIVDLPNSPARTSRVGAWVDAALTPDPIVAPAGLPNNNPFGPFGGLGGGLGLNFNFPPLANPPAGAGAPGIGVAGAVPAPGGPGLPNPVFGGPGGLLNQVITAFGIPLQIPPGGVPGQPQPLAPPPGPAGNPGLQPQGPPMPLLAAPAPLPGAAGNPAPQPQGPPPPFFAGPPLFAAGGGPNPVGNQPAGIGFGPFQIPTFQLGPGITVGGTLGTIGFGGGGGAGGGTWTTTDSQLLSLSGMDFEHDADPHHHPNESHYPYNSDYRELREEFRPQWKDRWSSWVNVAGIVKGGPSTLTNVYLKIVGSAPVDSVQHAVKSDAERKGKSTAAQSKGDSVVVGGLGMTWLKAADVVEAMVNRLAQRPTSLHVMQTLQVLSSFARSQRKKIAKREERVAAKQALSQPGYLSTAAGDLHTSTSLGAEITRGNSDSPVSRQATPGSSPPPGQTASGSSSSQLPPIAPPSSGYSEFFEYGSPGYAGPAIDDVD